MITWQNLSRTLVAQYELVRGGGGRGGAGTANSPVICDTGPQASFTRSAWPVNPTPPSDAAASTGHAETISQLQLQALQAATESGLPMLCPSEDERPALARPQRGGESRTQALDNLRQLRGAAQPLAAKLEVRHGQHHCWHA